MADAIRDVMTPDPVSVGPDASLVEAARKMRDVDSGAILVCEGDELRGLVTDRDIVVRAIADGRDPSQVKVREISSEELEALRPEDPVERAVELMRERHVRRIPVVENGHPVGIVSIGDLALARDKHSALAHISGAEPNR